MKWLLIALALSLFGIAATGCERDPTAEYNKGFQAGKAEGSAEGYDKGYRIGYNERHKHVGPSFGKNTSNALSIGMALGGAKILISILACIAYISFKRGTFYDPFAKGVASIAGAIVAFIVFKFTSIESLLVNLSLIPAWSNGLLLLFGTAIFLIIGYYFTSWMKFFATEISGIAAEAWCVFLLSASASAIAQVMYAASERAVDATSHAGGYALLGVLVGGLIYGAKLLVGLAEAEVKEIEAEERSAAHNARRLSGPK